MSLQYCKNVMDALFDTKSSGDDCNIIKLIFENNVLRGHTMILRTVSLFIRERSLHNPQHAVKPLEITIPHDENYTCYDCASKLLEVIYARNVEQIESDHEHHIGNLISFLQIIDSFKEYFYNKLLSKVPELKLNKVLPSTKNIQANKTNQKSSEKQTSCKKLMCIECSFQCYKPADLLSHITLMKHGKNLCSLCLFRSESTKQFNEHLRKHDNKKPFFCTTCDQRFSTRAFLAMHLPAHSTHAPFVCPHCPKAFKWKHGLNGHLLTHTKDKKHLCDECGFSTTLAKSLRAHKLTHSGDVFRCTHAGCTHTSLRKENMKIHLKTHSKEKPFVCEICGLNFTQNKNLQRHSLIHAAAKEKVYNCLHCSFKAVRSDYVRNHMQRQHTEKPLKLELCDNFADVLTIPEEHGGGGAVALCKTRSDLTVLADAASSCSHIDFPASSAGGEPVLLRNFDNLIANPVVVDTDC